MVYGDSLSAGYNLPPQDAFYTQLQEALRHYGYKDIEVIHQSKSGETTTGGVRRMQQAIDLKPDAVIIQLGSNDAFQREPVASIEKNFETMITAFQSKGIPVMLIGMQAPPTLGGQYRSQFAKMYQDLAKKYDVILYPFFMKDVIKVNLGSLTQDMTYVQADRIHPNKQGVAIMVKNVLPSVILFLRQNNVPK